MVMAVMMMLMMMLMMMEIDSDGGDCDAAAAADDDDDRYSDGDVAAQLTVARHQGRFRIPARTPLLVTRL